MRRAVVSLLAALIALPAILACNGGISLPDPGQRCPDGYRELFIVVTVWDDDDNLIGDQDFVMHLIATSTDPDYAGIYVKGEGVSRGILYSRDSLTDDGSDFDGAPPVLCHPLDRPVAITLRASFDPYPLEAYRTLDISLEERIERDNPDSDRIVVAHGDRRVELTDMKPLAAPNQFFAEARYVYGPPDWPGPLPEAPGVPIDE